MVFKILDGGLATCLVRMGYTSIDGDPLWSARLLSTRPNAIKDVHKRFLEAGADVLITASYQASQPGLVKHLGISESEATELIKLSTILAKEASEEVRHIYHAEPAERNDRERSSSDNEFDDHVSHVNRDGRDFPLVAGSVGPYGACECDGSEYTGKYVQKLTAQELMNWHRPRIHALVESGADILAVETIPAQKEAEAVLQLLKEEFPTAKAYLSYSCKDGPGAITCHGERFSDAIVPALQSDSVIAVGINCTSPQYISPLLKSVHHIGIKKDILVKPNSGEDWERHIWSGKENCLSLSSCVPEWMGLGATWLGGCCRVFPEDIQQLREAVFQEKSAN